MSQVFHEIDVQDCQCSHMGLAANTKLDRGVRRSELTNLTMIICCTVLRKYPKPPTHAALDDCKGDTQKAVNVVLARPSVHFLKKISSTCREYEMLGPLPVAMLRIG